MSGCEIGAMGAVRRNQGVINDKTAADLVETKAKCPHFYTLPKIHKNAEAPPGRPIVSSIRAPTERISAFVDIVLKPLVKSLPSYIKDTKDFLAKLKSLPGPLLPNSLLFTMDVVGLYNNIPHRDGLKACQLALDRRDACDPPTTSIVNLAKLVLELNAFQFEEKFFLQVLGTAMGTRMAPSYANIFMGILEESMLATAPGGLTPLFYGRFIDDVFGIWTHGEDTLLQFFDHANSCHRDIAFTYEYGISVPYLDVRATIVNSQIVTDLYEKPTNTHQYLLPTSNHPPHICKNLPYGLGLRLRVIISEQETLELRLKELSAFLTARGYSEGLVAKQFDRVRQKSREALLNTNRERAPVAHHEQTRTPLVCRWSSLLPPLQPLLKSAFPILAASERTKEIFDLPIVAYKRPKNLRDLLVHTRPPRPARDKNT